MGQPAIALHLPAGVVLATTPEGLVIRHTGDIIIDGNPGSDLARVESAGDIIVRANVGGDLIDLIAEGRVVLDVAFEGGSIRAARVVVADTPVACKSISASDSISIGAAQLTVDAIVAPQIDIDSKASGRVTVIESYNDRPPTNVKGGFSVRDYNDMIGDAVAFLAERGLDVLPERPGDAASEDDEVVQLVPQAGAAEDEEEEVDDPLSLSLEDLEPIEAEDGGAAVRAKINEAMRRISACYDGQDTPPAVAELQSLVDDGDVDALSQNIESVWMGLIGFHYKRGIRPHHQVTHAFNVIHALVS